MDMRRFREQTDRDLRDALLGYALMQINMCKKVEPPLAQVALGGAASLSWLLTGSTGVEQRQRMLPEDVRERGGGRLEVDLDPPP